MQSPSQRETKKESSLCPHVNPVDQSYVKRNIRPCRWCTVSSGSDGAYSPTDMISTRTNPLIRVTQYRNRLSPLMPIAEGIGIECGNKVWRISCSVIVTPNRCIAFEITCIHHEVNQSCRLWIFSSFEGLVFHGKMVSPIHRHWFVAIVIR